MYRPEIVLKATPKLINLIKSDWEKYNEFRKKAIEYLQGLFPDFEVVDVNERAFNKPYFWIRVPEEIKSFKELKEYVSKYPHIIAKGMHEQDGKAYGYLTISIGSKKGKEIEKEWRERFGDYEEACIRYDFGWYGKDIYDKLDFHQIDENTILAFLPQGKSQIAEKLIESGLFERVYIKTIKNPPNYAKEFNKKLKERLK